MSDLKIFAKTIDEKAFDQVNLLLKQPAFSHCKVRIMPDVHAGAGCVIGFTADLGEKVIPNIVGVDIGCGMLAVDLGPVEIDFQRLDESIRRYVPSGRNVNNDLDSFLPDLSSLRCYNSLKNIDWIKKSIGTLGGGNHFIEIDMDESGNKYLIIHSGSRNLGKQVAEHWQRIAIEKINGNTRLNEAIAETISDCKAEHRENEIQGRIAELKRQFHPVCSIPNDLCFLEGTDREDYLWDMRICQLFALHNRAEIAARILKAMRLYERENFETIHNYIDHESNIVRKGAISAKKGERLLIPINMRDGCILGIGKGNEDWNCSAPHGAGRIMSRSKAKKTISIEDYRCSMSGIFTSSVCLDTVDEAPQVYKPMQEILDCISDTVEVQKIIKPVYNFKAKE